MALVAVMYSLPNRKSERVSASEHGIEIMQQNCQKSERAWYSALESGLEMGVDIVLLQEPPVYKGYAHRGYQLISKREGRTMTAIRNGVNFKYEVREDLAEEGAGDLVIVDLFLPERLRIVNVYNQRVFKDGRQTNDKPAEKARWEDILKDRCVLAGDFNAHSPRWGSAFSRDHRFWEDLMDDFGLEYVGDGKPTRFDKTIDLVIATTNLYCTSQVVEDENHATGSDHEMLRTWIDVPRVEIQTASKRGGRKIGSLIDDIDYARTKNKSHPAELAWLDAQAALPTTFRTPEDLDRGAEMLASEIKKIIEKYAPVARVVAHSKAWWNDEIRDARKRLGQVKRTRMVEDWKIAKRELKSKIRQAKRKSWETWLEKADGPKVWEVLRGLSKPSKSLQMGPLIDENGTTSQTDQEKRKVLADISFPAQNSLHDVSTGERSNIPPWNLDWDKRVRNVIYNLPKNKAPGPDGVTESLIQTLEKLTPGFLTPIVRGCIEIGYHPREWRKAWGVPIPKQGKKDYRQAKAYRTISLLNTMGKIVEKVASEALTDHLEAGYYLSEGQFGGRRKRAAVDAVARLMLFAEEEWKKGKIVGALFMDVKGAFPTANCNSLARKLKGYNVPEHMIQWVRSFMSERKVWVEINGDGGNEISYTSGLPQGSPVSPILFNVLMSDRDTHVAENRSKDIMGLSFLDDVSWIASGGTVEEVGKSLQDCAARTIQWGTDNAVVFEPEKSEGLLLTRKRSVKNGTKVEVSGHSVSVEKGSVRWLGVFLDSELRLNEHHTTWMAKAKRRQAEIGRLCRKRGLPAFSVANLQKAVVQSVGTYGIELSAIGTDRPKVPVHWITQLQGLLNEQARRTMGAFKTTPEGFLMAESSMKPAAALIEKRQKAFQVRQLARPVQMRTVEKVIRNACMTGLMLEAQADGTMYKRAYNIAGPLVEEIQHRQQLGSRGAITILTREDAKLRATEDRRPGELKFYTDGSRSSKGYVGAGWCWKPDEEEYISGLSEYWGQTGEEFQGNFAALGKRCEVFDAELYAILRALQEAVRLRKETEPNLEKVTIFSDAQEALRRLQRDEESPGQSLSRSIWKWEESLDGIDIEYVWVPGHEGVAGNEAADAFAKRGADADEAQYWDRDSVTLWRTYSLSHLHRMVTEQPKITAKIWINDKLKSHKAYQPRRSLTFRQAFKPPWDTQKGRHPVSKSATAAFYQMACGHALTGAHLLRFNLKTDDGCGWCNGRSKQTRSHLFGRCRGLRVEYNRLCQETNKVLKAKGKKKRHRWKPWMFFKEEGLEAAVIEYMRRTGVGFEVRIGPQE